MIEKIKQKAQNNRKRVGLGIGIENEFQANRTFKTLSGVIKEGLAKLIIVTDNPKFQVTIKSLNIEVITSEYPEKTICSMLEKKELDSIVRGSLSSSKFLQSLKNTYKVQDLYRIALLKTAS